MVSPDGKLLNVSNFGTGLKGELGKGTVVVETSHCSEVLGWDRRGVVLADHRVCVGWVSDDNGLDVTLGVVVDGFACVNENLSVIFEEVSTFHAGAAGLSTNQEVVVNILEGNLEVTGDDNLVEEGEGAVVEFSLDTLEGVLGEGQI